MANLHVALAGNPNSGKTSAFNVLTGNNQFVGNWPGVTVERKGGVYKKNTDVTIDDLPGIYSLSPYTPEEVVARDYLLSGEPDVILNIVDGTNLERNLYLTTQLIETGIPTVVAVNMMDILEKSDKQINLEKLSYALGVPVIGISALKNRNVDKAVKEAIAAAKNNAEINYPQYDKRLEAALNEIETILGSTVEDKYARWYSVKLFERDSRASQALDLSTIQQKEIEETINITEKIIADDAESIIINERYNFISDLKTLCVVDDDQFKLSLSDKIDRIVTNRFLALPIFALVMWLIYYIAIQTVGAIGTDWVNDTLFGDIVPNFIETTLQSWQVAGWMQDLILNGIVAGIGAVLGFLPQLMVLFFCLALIEDCGYMARIAFVMDRFFRKFGLSGKSFIPMLIATGCGVPGVMASRTIENEKDRKMTVMLTTFMPCSAKLPIIALVAGAFFPNSSWVAPSAYFIGMSAIVLSGIALKKTRLFAGDPAPFIMELPVYHFPRIGNTIRYTYDHSKAFVKKAGTIIFVACILIWFTQTHNFMFQAVPEDQSILAALGNLVAPIFAPLGFGNWKAAVAAITGLIAKENVIGTFGILYNQPSVSENGSQIWGALRGSYTPVGAYSFLVFNLLCAPCFAAMGAIRREMANGKWFAGAIAYQCGLAYAVSFVVYQFGHVFFEGGSIGIGFILAAVVLAIMLYFILKKPNKSNRPTVTIQHLDEVKEWQL
ncbi:ferrous iron transport protein B [Enterococcus sp. AZ103]|uniref:ferrous iron transport protein B n=1 Tax=Enterococcus sp. AZ103 TaxID=2774628 RepID=UPI003F1EAEBC